MALNPGTRHLLREAASWTVVAVIGIAAFSHYGTLKTGAERMLGLPTSADVAASKAAPAHRGRQAGEPRLRR